MRGGDDGGGVRIVINALDCARLFLMRILLGLAALAVCSLAASAQPTYNKEISRLMQAKCGQCHQPGKIAPMSLLTYDDVSTYAQDIQRVLQDKSMPPWKPVPGVGDFRHSYGLNDGDRQELLDWIANGVEQGDPADAPDPFPVSNSPWDLGTPDLVLQPPAAYTPPRSVADTYRCFSLPTGLTADTWIKASQALPIAYQEVHHVLMLLDQNGDSARLDGADGQPGYDCYGDLGLGNLSSLQQIVGALVGSWVPGAQVNPLDDGTGILISANARIVLQVHYHPSGQTSPDQTSVGLYFSPPNSVKHRLLSIPLVNLGFKIPANNPSYPVSASLTLPLVPAVSGKIVLVLPHMHKLGRKTSANLKDRNGTVTPLIQIDDWDFNWQGAYMYTQAIPFAAGSTISMTAIYDNSDQNPRNPNSPIIPVGWGEGTNDEMCITLVGVVLDDESLLQFLPYIRFF
jgi:Copper type II ascorbate-dependent monooxygenase, C-terminal domain